MARSARREIGRDIRGFVGSRMVEREAHQSDVLYPLARMKRWHGKTQNNISESQGTGGAVGQKFMELAPTATTEITSRQAIGRTASK